MKKKIIAIGGGSMALGVTAAIDQEIISLCEKKNPTALLIPTATSDEPQYFKDFQKIYGNKYGCKTAVLELIKAVPSKKTIQKKINDADIIYVGGGNTLMMMRKWRFLGVD
ncbi:MAG: Type 1 glutamine amidotransferase-like domain-containing protein, partial [Chitinophagales bacterium]|nr:Type 1 glutamine amidotransferase-like domain-containing protein [Chitinophagales bacterium]